MMTENNSEQLKQLAQSIKLIIFDVDGVLTNGQIIYDSQGHELKCFNVKDGLAIKQAQKLGIETAIITARSSEVVQKRAKELGIKYLYQGVENKLTAFSNLINELNINSRDIAYLGDDWPDLPVLNQVGLPGLVQNAEPLVIEALNKSKFITSKIGGTGAAREFIYFILEAQDKLQTLIQQAQ